MSKHILKNRKHKEKKYFIRESHISEKCICACSVPQSCLTLCNPMDCSLPGCSVTGIPQARILDLVAISYSSRSSRPGIEPMAPTLTGRVFTTVQPGKSISEKRFDKTEKSMYKFLHLDLLHSVISFKVKM